MREILFRGCTTTTGEMVYGTGIFEDGHNTWICHLKPDKALEFGTVKKIVIPETIGQYTGLKDKSGKEIYEGDICTDHNQYNPQDLIIIEWRKAGFTGRYHNNNSYVSYIPDLACKKYLEVIGNIHENPELLK
jgi:uncharacterized phage protein (TIGR01671 family)